MRTSEQIKSEIEERFGFFPLFFSPALQNPKILENLWQQTLNIYITNPLPTLFKEKLFAYLSRYCNVPYCMVCHSCSLFSLGMQGKEVLTLLESPLKDLVSEQTLNAPAIHYDGISLLPELSLELEKSLIYYSELLFLGKDTFEHYRQEMQRLLGLINYQRLVAFIAYVEMCHAWTEAHPEVACQYHADYRVQAHLANLLQEEPALADFFRNYREIVKREYESETEQLYYTRVEAATQELTSDLNEHKQTLAALERQAIVLQEQAQVLELAHDAISIRDLNNHITFWNGGAEQRYGFLKSEAIGANIHALLQTQFPQKLAEIEEKLLREGCWEGELTQIKHDGTSVIVASRWAVQRDKQGQPIAILEINTDITKHKQAEKALQQANAKLSLWVNELEQRNREFVLLSALSNFLQACKTLEEAYTALSQLVEPLFPQTQGGIFLINSSNQLVEAVATWGASPLTSQELFTPDDCWALRRGRVHSVTETSSRLRCQHIRTNASPAQSLCVPMVSQGTTMGVLYLSLFKTAESRELTESKQQLAVAVAEHIALSLANLRLRETLHNQSIRDPLTGLFNRRYLEESLERELYRCDRCQQPLGIIMLDIDRFKRFNESYGHEGGDAVLRELGQFLHSQIRKSDIACRYGGEEFTLILPEAQPEIVWERAEQIRAGVKQLRVQHRDQLLDTITLSLGVAMFPQHGLTREAVLRAADAALYRAKQEGRDCIIAAP